MCSSLLSSSYHLSSLLHAFSFFFFNDTATTEIYTLSLHDALPIWMSGRVRPASAPRRPKRAGATATYILDRKSTRLNSSHGYISYAVFCLKKKKKKKKRHLNHNNVR